jgi:hypothetical protein
LRKWLGTITTANDRATLLLYSPPAHLNLTAMLPPQLLTLAHSSIEWVPDHSVMATDGRCHIAWLCTQYNNFLVTTLMSALMRLPPMPHYHHPRTRLH